MMQTLSLIFQDEKLTQPTFNSSSVEGAKTFGKLDPKMVCKLTDQKRNKILPPQASEVYIQTLNLKQTILLQNQVCTSATLFSSQACISQPVFLKK